MKLATRERLVYVIATVVAVAAALGALSLGGDLELTLVMVAAVVAGLVCFDTSMERKLHAFGPWVLLSLAPIAKTAPMVWQELRAESGASFERFDHAGSLLFGLCIFGAVVLLAQPAPSLGSSTAAFDRAAIAGSALTAALAGASVAFLFDRDFGSVTAGRIFETPTWFFVGGILAAAVIAASRTEPISAGLAGVLCTAAAGSAMLAYSVAGRDFDRGWWAVVFAALTVTASATGGDLGRRDQRDRLTNASVVIVMIAGAIAAAAAISARSDRTAWGPGWALLGVLALALFALAMASRPLDEQSRSDTGTVDPQDIGLGDTARAARAKERARIRLREATPLPELSQSKEPVRATAPPVSGPAQIQSVPATAQPSKQLATQQPIDQPSVRETVSPHPAAQHAPPAAEQTVAQPAPQPAPQPALQRQLAPVPTQSAVPLSGGDIVAAARAAAEVRTARPVDRHSLAPLEQAHHFDPSTGLLSAAGLKHAIARAFDVPRQAGHVTIMMFMIRDLDRIENQHGRLASAAVTRVVAERVAELLPDGSGARFARSAYAIVFVGDMSDSHQTIQRLARVLLQLRAPVEGGSLGDKIDVVAGMAQCYEREESAQFVKRANMGLARAAQTPEPTFVAMP